jgi:carbamoyltransferase
MVLKLVQNALIKTKMDHICLAGGIFSNVKVNRLIRMLPETKKCFVFPHMGDGGLALGAAIELNNKLNSIQCMPLRDLYLGQNYSGDEIEHVLKKYRLSYVKSNNIVSHVAKIITDGGIVFWFQGRMEIGPRSLGARSILARADSEDIKDALNLQLKKRVWYQPFCPSMLEEDAKKLLEDYDGCPDEFMTMAYMVKKELRDHMRGVINVDGSCRPQIVCKDSLFRNLLVEIKKISGLGVVLNTSFNIHGEPVVCSPEDAVKAFLKTKNRYLAINNFVVKQ